MWNGLSTRRDGILKLFLGARDFQGSDKKPKWVVNVEKDATRLAANIEKAFIVYMVESRKKLPFDDEVHLTDQLNIFLDALISTTCVVAGRYVNTGQEFEDVVVSAVREKFTLLRKHVISGGKL